MARYLLFATVGITLIYRITCLNKSVIDEPCKQQTSGTNKLFVALMILIFIAGVLGNTLSVIVITLSPLLRQQKTNTYIISLALSDLALLLFNIPLKINQYGNNQSFCFSLMICKLQSITNVATNIASATHLFVISFDRFISISRPFFYQNLNKNIPLIFVLCIWVYTAVWTSLGVFNWQDPKFPTFSIEKSGSVLICIYDNKTYFLCVFLIATILPLVIMAVFYGSILKIALRHVRTIATLVPSDLKNATKFMGEKRKQEIKITKTLAIVYGSFAISYLPMTVIAISSNMCPECYTQFRKNNQTIFFIVVAIFVEILPSLNLCINPFIYVIFNEQFRKSTKVLIFKLLKQPYLEGQSLRTLSKRYESY